MDCMDYLIINCRRINMEIVFGFMFCLGFVLYGLWLVS